MDRYFTLFRCVLLLCSPSSSPSLTHVCCSPCLAVARLRNMEIVNVDSSAAEGVVEVSVDGPSRDLAAAKQAYKAGDADASRVAHEALTSSGPPAAEKHGGAGSEYVRSIVFGAMDGIMTTFAHVAAVAGSNIATEVVIVLAFSNLIADAIAMGVGDYISTKAENDHVYAERKRETWEYDNFKEGEINEMVELYVNKGFEEPDAREILTIMAKNEYKDFFIDHMMVEELGKAVPDADDSPAKAGLAMFVSFCLFGSLPAWTYVIFHLAGYNDKGGQFGVSCAMTAIALFLLGVVQAKFTESNRLFSGLLMTFQGSLTAGAAYLVGWALSLALKTSDCP